MLHTHRLCEKVDSDAENTQSSIMLLRNVAKTTEQLWAVEYSKHDPSYE